MCNTTDNCDVLAIKVEKKQEEEQKGENDHPIKGRKYFGLVQLAVVVRSGKSNAPSKKGCSLLGCGSSEGARYGRDKNYDQRESDPFDIRLAQHTLAEVGYLPFSAVLQLGGSLTALQSL